MAPQCGHAHTVATLGVASVLVSLFAYVFQCTDLGLQLRAVAARREIAQLLGINGPLAMTACYLRRDGLVLELLHFAAPERQHPPIVRSIDEPGLTHISLSCDIEAICELVADFGGEVLSDTHIGTAVFIRDPDGQLVELLQTFA